MELVGKLDVEATKANAQKILLKYRTQKSYANAPINPKVTAAYGDGGSAGTAPKPEYAEEYAIKAEQGQRFCDWVDWAINTCRKHKYREILKITFCEGYDETHLIYMDKFAQRIGRYDISSSTYFKWFDSALLDVAERLGCQIFYEE